MGLCKDCIHFRRVKPASQLLAQAIGTTDASISNALVKIQEDEAQQRGAEAQMRAKKEVAGEQEWGFRPTMSDFCALNEESGMVKRRPGVNPQPLRSARLASAWPLRWLPAAVEP